MKKIISVIGIILIFVLTPLLPIIAGLLMPDLTLSGFHGNMINGYAIDELNYRNIHASKITINNKLEFSAEKSYIKKVSAKAISIAASE